MCVRGCHRTALSISGVVPPFPSISFVFVKWLPWFSGVSSGIYVPLCCQWGATRIKGPLLDQRHCTPRSYPCYFGFRICSGGFIPVWRLFSLNKLNKIMWIGTVLPYLTDWSIPCFLVSGTKGKVQTNWIAFSSSSVNMSQTSPCSLRVLEVTEFFIASTTLAWLHGRRLH